MDALSYSHLVANFFSDGGELISSRPERMERAFDYVMQVKFYWSLQSQTFIRRGIKSVDATFIKKWEDAKCVNLEHFKEVYQNWTQRNLQLPSEEPNKRTGRPKKAGGFDDLSEATKNRRAAELGECELEKLLLAAAQAARKSGKKDMEHVLRLLYKDREVATRICGLLKAKELPHPVKMSPSRGLTHLLDMRFSKRQYTATRLLAKEYNADVFPAYNKVREAKQECRPPADCLKINDVSAALPMQSLLDHTASRLLLLQKEVIEALVDNEITITLEAKWGCDGSSDQSQFNQKYVNVTTKKNDDANLFATTVAALRMTTNDGKIVHNNLSPNSPFCVRPLRLQHAKETPTLTLETIQSVKEEIRKLTSLEITLAGKKITVNYKLYLTMIDGKVLSVETRTTSHQSCSICKCTPKQFNNLSNPQIRFKPQEGTLNYGISVLHLWIRCFECLLHISYRLEIKPKPKWQLRGAALKMEGKRRKGVLQDRFWEKMSLRVDFPSKKGSGYTNSGPVARKAFSDPKLLADILDMDVDLVKKISTILIALSCQLPLEADLFHDFCDKTAQLYVSKYNWFPMSQSVHKVLIHSRDIMLANDLPLGVLAEDAAESCNKLYRHNRQFHARNVSRKQNLMDVFNRALDTSDPIISNFSLKKRLNSRCRKNIPTEVLQLLRSPDIPASKEDERLLMEGNDDDEENFDDPLNEKLEGLEGLNLPVDPLYEDDEDNDEEEEEEDNDDDDPMGDEDADNEDDDAMIY